MSFHLVKFLLLIPLVSGSAIRREAAEDAPGTYLTSAEGALTGELRKWHKITLGFEGPETSERASYNPFTSYRLEVTFRHDETGKEYFVPGYYAATGDAAHTSADSGNVFLVHFSPDEVGVWEWTASFVKGNWIVAKSIEAGTSAGFFDGQTGQFEVLPTDKEGRDLRGKGRLQYVHQQHMQFAETKEWFFQAGADSPENFLAYEDFDNTPNYGGYRKSWAPHIPDFNDGDPTWADGKGTGIIGAINYLSEQGMNSVSMLTFNVDGDDRNVFLFRNPSNFKRLDCSKLAQWEIVFEHADKMGLHLHFKTQEHENDQLMNEGRLGKVRKLYYRELIARFGHHLALTYNLGEENTNLSGRLRKFANYFEENDPYNTLVVVHTYPDQKELVYTPQLGIEIESFDGASLQSSPVNVYDETLEWIQKSAENGRPWVVTNDEQNPQGVGVKPDLDDPSHTKIRRDVLWGNLVAGGGGVAYYFGYKSVECSDLTCEDYRSRANMWETTKHALDFLNDNAIPFGEMSSANYLLSDPDTGLPPESNLGFLHKWWCLATKADSAAVTTLVVYLRKGGTVDLNLSLLGPDACTTSFSVHWYDPRNGGALLDGTVTHIVPSAGTAASVGSAPSVPKQDWAVLLRCDPDSN